jgi:hypothetical protein
MMPAGGIPHFSTWSLPRDPFGFRAEASRPPPRGLADVPIGACVLAFALMAAPSSLAAQSLAADTPIIARTSPCATGPEGEIVVCGRRQDDESYRLPPSFRDRRQPGDRVSGLPSASLDTGAHAECGIFQHQRRCNKADAAEFGYGNGRDPISVIAKIVSEAAQPED